MAKKSEKQKKKIESYLNAVFSVFSALKKQDSTLLSSARMRFNNTELRLIGEILSAKYEGKRLISTQLATRLGITRSAVSQIVNKLEKDGVLRRVADDVDRKIAYIEILEKTIEDYKTDLDLCREYMACVVEHFGEEKFKQWLQYTQDFITVAELERKNFSK